MASLNWEMFYRFTRLDNRADVIVKRDDIAPSLISGGGRWNLVNRPRRFSITTYDGSDPRRMDVPVLFDGWDDIDSVESDINILNHMRMPTGDFNPPPVITVEGALPVPMQPDIRWVIEGIDFGTGNKVIWHERGYRLRQDAVVHLLQFIPPNLLLTKPPATSHMYTVHTGDTLKSISRDQYGTTKYASLIQRANNIRDPKKLPKTLRIPPIVSISG